MYGTMIQWVPHSIAQFIQLLGELLHHVFFAFLIESDAKVEKVAQNLIDVGILSDSSVGVETHHIGSAQRARHLEFLLKRFLLTCSHLRWSHVDDEMHRGVGVVLFVVLEEFGVIYKTRLHTLMHGGVFSVPSSNVSK